MTRVGKTYPSVGRCIYCLTASSDLRREHIISYGLGGQHILPRASCASCAEITSSFEGFCLREMLGPFRVAREMKTRRPKQHLVQSIAKDGPPGSTPTVIRTVVPAEDLPRGRICVPKFDMPGALSDQRITGTWTALHLFDPKEFVRQEEKYGGAFLYTVYDLPYARMLAKIAHSYAIAELGLGAFTPRLCDLILGRDKNYAFWVGGPEVIPPKEAYDFMLVQRIEESPSGQKYVVITIRLLAYMGAPVYYVVVGESLR